MHTSQSDTNAPPPIILSDNSYEAFDLKKPLTDTVKDSVFKNLDISRDTVIDIVFNQSHYTSKSETWTDADTDKCNTCIYNPNTPNKVFCMEDMKCVSKDDHSSSCTGLNCISDQLGPASSTCNNHVCGGPTADVLSADYYTSAPYFFEDEQELLPFICNSICQLSCDAFKDTKDTTDEIADLCKQNEQNTETNPYPKCQLRCVNTLSNMPLAKFIDLKYPPQQQT